MTRDERAIAREIEQLRQQGAVFMSELTPQERHDLRAGRKGNKTLAARSRWLACWKRLIKLDNPR